MSATLSHCLILPEILDNVCLYLPRGELARLARSSRCFFHSAARQLWSSGSVEDKDVLNLLPNALVVHSDEKTTTFEVNIPAVLPPDFFDRLNLYAPFIRHITVSSNWSHSDEYYRQRHLPGWSSVQRYTRDHVLLPNLERMEVIERHEIVTSSKACADWLSVLIPPSLSVLELFRSFVNDSPGSIERYLNLMDGILAKCSKNLRRLKLYNPEPAINQLTEPSLDDPASIPIVPGALVTRALKHLVGMPHIRELEIPDLSSTLEVPTLPDPASCRLKSFRVLCGATEPFFRLWQTPIISHLTQLSLSTNWPGSTSAISEMHDLTSLIAASSPHLTKISLYLGDIPDTDHLMDVLYPLHTLRLSELVVNGIPATQPPQQISLRKMAEYWPLLEVLEIRHAGTTFDELITVSSYLPRLNCLLLQLESAIPTEVIAEEAPSQTDCRPCQDLELVSDFRCVHTFNTAEADAFARFLTKMWRTVNIKCYCRGYNHGPEYEEFKVTLAQYYNGALMTGTA